MRDIRRPDILEPLVERLTSPKYSETSTPIFATIMDLLIFAAGVGLKCGRRAQVPSSGKGIPMRIFENNQKDGFLYLLALAVVQDSSALETTNDDEIVRIFEEFAAGGLEQIAEWLAKDPQDFSGVETLLAEIQRIVPLESPQVDDPSPI